MATKAGKRQSDQRVWHCRLQLTACPPAPQGHDCSQQQPQQKQQQAAFGKDTMAAMFQIVLLQCAAIRGGPCILKAGAPFPIPEQYCMNWVCMDLGLRLHQWQLNSHVKVGGSFWQLGADE